MQRGSTWASPARWTAIILFASLLPSLTPTRDAAAHVSNLEGLYGGTVEALAVAPGGERVLAATHHGLFRSTNGGASWRPAATTLGRSITQDVAFHPSDADVAFAVVGHEVYRTSTGGQTWFSVDLGVDAGAQQIIISPTHPNHMLIRGDRAIVTSDDGGVTWTTILTKQDEHLASAGMSPSGETILVCSQLGGNTLRRSTDRGQTWMTTSFQPLNCGDFAWDSTAPNVVWTEDGPMQRSDDGGLTWTAVRSPFPYNWGFVVPPGASSSLITAGHDAHVGLVARTSDGGATWTVSRMEGQLTSVAVDPANTQHVFAGAIEGGIRKSVDGGQTFRSANEGLTAQPAIAVAADPRDAGTVYAALGAAGTYRSADAGQSWTPIHAGMRSAKSDPLAAVSAELLTVDAAGTVFAGGSLDWAWGITRSGDGGMTWSEPVRLQSVYPTALVAHPTVPDVILAGTVNIEAGASRGSVYRTSDGGATWAAVGPYGVAVSDLTRHRDTETVYALLRNDGLWRSDDFGLTWRQVKLPSDMWSINVVATGETADVVYVGGRGVRRSDDGGQTWSARPEGGGVGGEVTSLAADPLDPTQLVAGTHRSGLWISSDRGVSWSLASTGGEGEDIQDIEFTAPAAEDDATAYKDQPLLMGTARWTAAGMWRMTPAPNNRRRPSLIGKLQVGKTLTARPGRWSRARNYRYQWYRGTNPIKFATSSSYTIRKIDRGTRLQCRVTARGLGGSTRAFTPRTLIP